MVELVCKLAMDRRNKAVRLRCVDRPVENEVGLRGRKITASPLTGERIVAVDPLEQLVAVQMVGRYRPTLDSEPSDRTVRTIGVVSERVDTRGDADVCIASTFECVGNRGSDAV